MKFLQFWKMINLPPEEFTKSKLTKEELAEVNKMIDTLQAEGKPSSAIIKVLQKSFPKLAEEYQAARAFWTEVKRMDTHSVKESSEDLGFDKFRVILSPNACVVCKKKTDDGRKIFTKAEISKSGFGHAPPFHPNCYCILVPDA